MKFFIFISFLAGQVFALNYKIAKSESYPFMDIHEISQKMKTENFLEMDISKKGNIFNNSFDQIYFNTENRNQIAILKLDIKLDQPVRVLKISDTEFVCHGQTSRDRYFSLYMNGQNLNHFNKICNRVNKKTFFSFKKYLFKKFISTAQADVNCTRQQSNFDHLSSVAADISENKLAQRIGTCAVEAVRSGLQTYKGSIDAVVSILTQPFELWQKITEQGNALKNFVMNLKSEILSLHAAVKNIDLELIWSLGCQLAGELLATVHLSAIGGLGIIKLTGKLLNIFNSLKQSQILLNRLSLLSKSGRSDVAREILSCVVK